MPILEPEMVPQGPYELVDTDYPKQGKCMECLVPIAMGTRWYRNLTTGEDLSVRVRTACDCHPDMDPYKRQVAPPRRIEPHLKY